jgi:leucyl/phenylalanyl-tRNA--protein transferase
VYRLGPSLEFPPGHHADEGLLAIGGDLSPERLLSAYRSGIFPWYSEGQPILWHCPDPRCVLPLEGLHIGRSLRRTLAKRIYDLRFDTAFDEVVLACSTVARAGQEGTWITREMASAYGALHRLGYAHSVEAWQEGALVGGLYGVSLGRMFFGESMFTRRPDASKVALVTLAKRISQWGFSLMDAQVANPHTLAMGAEEWPRSRFLRRLKDELTHPTRRGDWGKPEPDLEPPG